MSSLTTYVNLHFTSGPLLLPKEDTPEQALATAIRTEAKKLFGLEDAAFNPRHVPSIDDRGYAISVTKEAASQARRLNPEYVVRSKNDY